MHYINKYELFSNNGFGERCIDIDYFSPLISNGNSLLNTKYFFTQTEMDFDPTIAKVDYEHECIM